MKLALSLGTLAGANIALTALVQWYILVAIGPGMETDALFASLAVPQLVLAVISDSLVHVLVPLMAGETPDDFHREVWEFVLLIGSLFSLLSGLLYILVPLWTPLLFPGLAPEALTLTNQLSRIQLVGMVFTALTGVLWAAYHARQRFIWAELTPVIGTGVSLALTIWLLPHFGVLAAAWANVARFVLQTILLAPILGRFRTPEWHGSDLQEAWHRIQPLLLGTSYYKTGPLIDRFLSSMTPAGGLSLFYLGQQLHSAATVVINKAIAAPMVPILATHAKGQTWTSFRALYRRRLEWILGLTGGGFVILLLLGRPILQFLIGHGAVTDENVLTLWWIMIGLTGVLVGGCAGQILSTAFYAKGDTATPTKIGVIGFTVGIALKIGGFLLGGLMGIAIGTSVYYLANTVLLYVLLERKLVHAISSSGQTGA
ncbi:MAG: polysaccharide biosynthesis C-terminal domain-containing protein [Anaerolineae bacterium]|nr:polysaccharide biosynthesis C-terminal domain-containing protein [Anaerolineae bacterium]